MRPGRLLSRLESRSLSNVSFRDLARLLAALGFQQIRTSGSHHIYAHPQLPELVNLQEVKGQIKPYQARQVLKLIQRYNLGLDHRAEDEQ